MYRNTFNIGVVSTWALWFVAWITPFLKGIVMLTISPSRLALAWLPLASPASLRFTTVSVLGILG
ncbi:hypothetical protein F5Y13DRAFT_171852 [Hypoxylon sp. FL1857]|nr:hypothetical protein F5Y13DRAFT_171852 [Hypoxylon sp. FL1857]